jgi:hypothetical protein
MRRPRRVGVRRLSSTRLRQKQKLCRQHRNSNARRRDSASRLCQCLRRFFGAVKALHRIRSDKKNYQCWVSCRQVPRRSRSENFACKAIRPDIARCYVVLAGANFEFIKHAGQNCRCAFNSTVCNRRNKHHVVTKRKRSVNRTRIPCLRFGVPSCSWMSAKEFPCIHQ